MEFLVNRFFFHQWQRKLLAFLAAIFIWFFVNHSISSSKTIASVPIRIINTPADQTIQDLQPNGFMSKRITLTLTGTKNVIDQLEPGDVEILLDASHLGPNGFVQITKKNLVSLNPHFNLLKHVSSVTHPEFVIKMSPVLTDNIPITINSPVGDPPPGYEFLDIWPMHLLQTVSGPKEEVLSLKNKGLELTFSLHDITKEHLDSLQENEKYEDEVTFYIPESWKKIHIPFLTRGPEVLNDPEAKNLQINFLRKSFIPIKQDLSLQVFYPLKYSTTINPSTYPLLASNSVQFKNHLPILSIPLLAANVSELFVEIVKHNLEIEIVAVPPTEREWLEWSVNFIDPTHLEDAYVAFLLSKNKSIESVQTKIREREKHYRNRFRMYMQQFTLYISPQNKLEIESWIEDGKIKIHVPNIQTIHAS